MLEEFNKLPEKTQAALRFFAPVSKGVREKLLGQSLSMEEVLEDLATSGRLKNIVRDYERCLKRLKKVGIPVERVRATLSRDGCIDFELIDDQNHAASVRTGRGEGRKAADKHPDKQVGKRSKDDEWTAFIRSLGGDDIEHPQR